MCRIFRIDSEEKSKMNAKNNDDEYEENTENITYSFSIGKIIKYINQEYIKLKKSYEEYLEKKKDKKTQKLKSKTKFIQIFFN